jgi:hypothetical protein
MPRVTRSAKSGKFVTKARAKASPSRTITQTTGGPKHGVRLRSAITGRFVSEAYARSHPDTTVAEGG